MKYDLKKIGKRIKTERKNHPNKYNQTNFGRKLKDYKENGFNRDTVASWEKGEALPDIDVLLKMCEIFNCELGYLLCEFDTKTRINADIQKETGLSEESIEALRAEAKKDFDLKATLHIKSKKTKLIEKFILECDSIADDVRSIESSEELLTYCEESGINPKIIQEAYSLTQNNGKTPSENIAKFQDKLLEKYPPLSNSTLLDLYVNQATAKAIRFNMDQQFNRIIDDLLDEERLSKITKVNL